MATTTALRIEMSKPVNKLKMQIRRDMSMKSFHNAKIIQ